MDIDQECFYQEGYDEARQKYEIKNLEKGTKELIEKLEKDILFLENSLNSDDKKNFKEWYYKGYDTGKKEGESFTFRDMMGRHNKTVSKLEASCRRNYLDGYSQGEIDTRKKLDPDWMTRKEPALPEFFKHHG